MRAAASGNSTIGIPQSVGEDFAAADHARGPAKLPARKRSDFHTAMQSHGFSKGDGKHSRHPATDHYKAPSVSQARYRSGK
jgi:hypothetical protein